MQERGQGQIKDEVLEALSRIPVEVFRFVNQEVALHQPEEARPQGLCASCGGIYPCGFLRRAHDALVVGPREKLEAEQERQAELQAEAEARQVEGMAEREAERALEECPGPAEAQAALEPVGQADGAGQDPDEKLGF